jgi:hypothetical protein
MRVVSVRCDEVADQLGDVADGSTRLAAPARLHVDHCLRCQAEIASYRRLRRSLRGLRDGAVEPTPGLLDEVLSALEVAGGRGAIRSVLSGRRVAYVGGIAAATAAGVGGAIVIATRTRRRLPMAG